MSAGPLPRISPEQYLYADRAAEIKSEYYDGFMYAMSGGTVVHAVIIGNLTGELRQALRKRPCLVCPADVRVRVSDTGLYTYPDVVVVCAGPRFSDGEKDTLLNPDVIIEVLSKSTEAHDRGFKFAHYRQLDSLQEYLLVSQTESRVEKFQRHVTGQWILTEYSGIEAICEIDSIDCKIALSDIYEKVPLGSG